MAGYDRKFERYTVAYKGRRVNGTTQVFAQSPEDAEDQVLAFGFVTFAQALPG